MSRLRDTIIRRTRTIAVVLTGGIGIIGFSMLTVSLLRINIAKGEGLDSLTASLIGCLLVGGVLTGLCCLAVFHALSFWRSVSLKKALRLVESLQMLGAKTHKERLEAIRHYSIRVFKTKMELPSDIAEDIQCKEVSTFLSPMFYNLDRLNAIGSPYYCCDFEQIQGILDDNKAKWGDAKEQPGDFSVDTSALERRIADLTEQYQNRTKEFTAASGREGRLKKQQEEQESHMAVLVELAANVSTTIKPPRTITEKEIKAKYLAIGKIYGISKVPGAYVEIFRKNMPKDIINWGGAPNQGSDNEET